MTEPNESGAAIGRRHLLVAGGSVISLGGLLAACGGTSAGSEPGRVGYAPVPTPLPSETVDDAVLLRTAQSFELMLVEVYGALTERGALTGTSADLLARLVDEHTAIADEVGELVTAVGGEPYECANPWYTERVAPLIFERFTGDGGEIEPTDDEARDVLAVMNAMESVAGSMYQGMIERLTEPELRADVMRLAARSVRHAASVAIASTGAPEAYFSPAVRGEEVVAGENGLVPLYAVPAQFGTLSAHQLVIGAASAAGTRATLSVETPADNSFVYLGQSCSA